MANVGALREAVRTSNISLVKRLVKGGVCVDERLWVSFLMYNRKNIVFSFDTGFLNEIFVCNSIVVKICF